MSLSTKNQTALYVDTLTPNKNIITTRCVQFKI